MSRPKPRYRAHTHVRASFAALAIALSVMSAASPVAGQKKLRIFDGHPKVIVVNGYSTSYKWPQLLQRKLNRYTAPKQVIEVELAVRGGTGIAELIDVKTGRPREPWFRFVRPPLQKHAGQTIIVLAQQSLQQIFGERPQGIRGPNDAERITLGADALETYVRLLKADGADLVFVATHIYLSLIHI